MLSTLIFDECSVQTMLQMKQFAKPEIHPERSSHTSSRFFIFFSYVRGRNQTVSHVVGPKFIIIGPLILFHKRHGLYPQIPQYNRDTFVTPVSGRSWRLMITLLSYYPIEFYESSD